MDDLSFGDDEGDEDYIQLLTDRIQMDAEYITELQEEIKKLKDYLMV